MYKYNNFSIVLFSDHIDLCETAIEFTSIISAKLFPIWPCSD